MAYMRGDYYLWDDESGLHIWAYDGYDSWNKTGWHLDDNEDGSEDYPIAERHLVNGENKASGVSIHQEVMDEYVMMRLAEMINEGKIESAIDRVLDPNGRGGNFGGRLIRANAETIKQVLNGLKMRPAPPYDWAELSREKDVE